jgi:hypothetical protein
MIIYIVIASGDQRYNTRPKIINSKTSFGGIVWNVEYHSEFLP